MYDELIKWLRNCTSDTVEDCAGCPYQGGYKGTYCMNGLITQAADAIEKLSMRIHGDEAAIAGMKREIERMVVADKPRWIPVTERLPERNGTYLVYVYGDVTDLNYWNGKWHRLGDDYTKAVTNWMPLPKPPKDGET